MSSANTKDYFGAFLAAADGPVGSPAQSAPEAVPPEVGAEKVLLSFLAVQSAPISLKDILGQLELPPSLAITTLHRLAEAKLVELQRTQDDECALITDLGRRVGG